MSDHSGIHHGNLINLYTVLLLRIVCMLSDIIALQLFPML